MDLRLHLAICSVLIVLMLTSCRSTDNTMVENTGSASVKINLLDAVFYQGNSSQASLKGDVNEIPESIQLRSTLVGPSMLMLTELVSISKSASSGMFKASTLSNAVSSVPGDPLGIGVKFRVIAYRQSSGTYQAHQDYTIGQEAIPIMLDNGSGYDIVVYSYGTTTLPAISSGETTTISGAQLNYDDTNRDFLYEKISYTPVNAQNILNITLHHKVALITTSISSDFGAISAINNAGITPHYSDGTIPLSSGNITNRTASTSGAQLYFPGPFPNAMQTASPVFVNTSSKVSFSADITINGLTKNINVADAFDIVPGYKNNLSINFKKCGAYIAPGVFKEFMCHNLGADTSANPFTPSEAIHGAKYQWGKLLPALTQAQDQDPANDLGVAGWDTSAIADDEWSDSSKTINDPCPSGFRVPTQAQWQAVIDNNTVTYIGPWTDSTTNYTSGILIGNNLFLPATGTRNPPPGSINNRGKEGTYWSSSWSSIGTVNVANQFVFADGYTGRGNLIRQVGSAVRCIKE